MVRKIRPDPKTGVVKQPLGKVILGGTLVFGVLILTSAIFPAFASCYLYITVPAGIFGLTSLVWLNVRPNLYARFFLNIFISVLCLIIAFRGLDNIFPQYSYINALLIFSIGAFAHSLPIRSPATAKFLREELSAPKTKIGKIVFRVSLAIIPIIGILSAMVESILNRENKSVALSMVLIILGLLVSVVLPFGYRFPSSPWEVQEK